MNLIIEVSSAHSVSEKCDQQMRLDAPRVDGTRNEWPARFSRRGRRPPLPFVELGPVFQAPDASRAAVRLEMALERSLVLRQQVIQHAIQPAVIDGAVGRMSQIIESRRRVPACFGRQLAPRRAQPVDGENRGDARPRHIGVRVIYARGEELVQPLAIRSSRRERRRKVADPVSQGAVTAKRGFSSKTAPRWGVAPHNFVIQRAKKIRLMATNFGVGGVSP